MEEQKKWWQSRTIQAAIALIVAGITFAGVSFGIVDPAQLDSATTVYPEVGNGIALIKGGQLFSGLSVIVGALVIYFRQKATAKIQA